TEPTTKKKPHYKKHQIGRHQKQKTTKPDDTNDERRKHAAKNTEWEALGTEKKH
ncbi:4613_t:CDS:1, partial [Dentiscutata erythropus]